MASRSWARTTVVAIILLSFCALGEPSTQNYLKTACPDYKDYSLFAHRPYSQGPLHLPFQRPSIHCRTFISPAVEEVIADITERMIDKDLARLFENAFPNTLDTTVRWHIDGNEEAHSELKKRSGHVDAKWAAPQSFVVTGDINAEWLRDSTNQLLQYQPLASRDKALFNLILGAINTQAEYVIRSPYCNAFQPPPPSGLYASQNGMADVVHPAYEPSFVFECKYELDSLAHFLAIGNTFHESTGSLDFLNTRWYAALDEVTAVIDEQSKSTFEPETGKFHLNEYTFRRQTDSGTETLSLDGVGNPLNNGTGLVRSAFRPSDDATLLGFLIPANALMSVELARTAALLKEAGKDVLAQKLQKRSEVITAGIWAHGTVQHKVYGEVFAYEVDGYGSHILMDDANIPSLLSLPVIGFCEATHPIYINTRRMLLSAQGNPYYLRGSAFQGIGGPHIGFENAWPMSVLMRAQTTEDEAEIREALEQVLRASKLGLVHESIHVERLHSYTRSWFAWANSVFAQTILDLARRKPEVLFGPGAAAYDISAVPTVDTRQ